MPPNLNVVFTRLAVSRTNLLCAIPLDQVVFDTASITQKCHCKLSNLPGAAILPNEYISSVIGTLGRGVCLLVTRHLTPGLLSVGLYMYSSELR